MNIQNFSSGFTAHEAKIQFYSPQKSPVAAAHVQRASWNPNLSVVDVFRVAPADGSVPENGQF